MILYPYILKAEADASGHYNDDGDWVPANGGATFVDYCKCRDEANSGGKIVTGSDGINHVFDRLILTPLGTKVLPPDKKIQVWEGATLRFAGHVLQAMESRLHTRIWC